MNEVSVDPASVQKALDDARPGTVIRLRPGRYKESLRLVGKAGEPGQPIVIRGEPGAVIDGDTAFASFNIRAQLAAKADWLLGRRPPGIQAIALEAAIVIDACDHVRVENLSIRRSWPTAVLIDNSTNVLVRKLDIEDGAFAFFLHGERCRRVIIEDCSWVQDTSRGDIWKRIDWERIHGDDWTEADVRGLDGDFLRSYRIAGDLIVRRNHIEHAFNGVHCFNRRSGPSSALNRNIYIYSNTFAHIRDNPIEPEVTAWNFWIFHNKFYNCHKWLSLELDDSDLIYIFGNVGWYDDVPGPPGDDNNGGSVLKLLKQRKREGRHYIFNNSWYLRSPILKEGELPTLLHMNNAVVYGDPHVATFGTPPGLWFESRNNWIESKPSERDGFENPKTGDFRLKATDEACRGRGRPVTVEMTAGRFHTFEAPNIGAYQADDLLQPPASVPDFVIPETMDMMPGEAPTS